MLESLSNKVAGLKVGNFITKRVQHRSTLLQRESNTSPVNIAKFQEQLFLQNTSGGCFCQLDIVTIQYWGSADISFLVKNTM